MSINSDKRLVPTLLVFAVLTIAGAPDACAQGTYFTRASVLTSFFSRSERVTFRKFELDRSQVKQARVALGYAPAQSWTVYYGTTGSRVDGVAIIDHEKGQHKPITVATLLDSSGAVSRVEVMVYREGHGGEIRRSRFLRQFRGRTAADAISVGRDVDVISGATISSGSLARAVRRAVVLTDILLIQPGGSSAALQPAERPR